MSSTVAPQASAAASVVSVRDLRKVYGPVVAVDDVSLDVRRGEFLTLLGPSGSGKTTVLGIIAGLIAPTRGTLRLSGEDVTDLPSNLRNIGVVFQSYALFPHMTVAENIAFPLKMHKVPGAEIPARVAQMLQTVQLGDLGDRRPAQLSGGQQQRVALARALVFKPTVLLMDEPLSALDRKLRQQMQLEIKQLQRALALTIVCVTHDQEEALAVSDRIAVMNRGRIEQIGAPEQLYERPSNHFVADFLGESNILRGTVERSIAGLTELRTASGLPVRIAVQPGSPLSGSVDLLLRPERILLGAAAQAAANCFDGVVRQLTYAGDARRLVIGIGDATLTARVPAHSGPRLQVGEQVAVGWSAEDLYVLPG